MAEYVRSVTVTVEVDTNKRTERATFTGSTAGEDAQRWIEGVVD